MYLMGIDGGGSTIRVVIITRERDVLVEYLGPAVNPGVVGRDEAASRIRAAMLESIQQAGLTPEQIAGVGLGVAGASNRYEWAIDWLRRLAGQVTPQARIIASSDYEIALVGAHGQRFGILLLAGTGSLAYGVNAAGESVLVGGWGYLIGDEGSGYWLGSQALRAVARMDDRRGRNTALFDVVMSALNLSQPLDLIPFLYGSNPRVADVARLAPLVLECAAQGDPVARGLVETGALELALAVRAVAHRLDMHGHAPMFAGSLLTTSNQLSTLVCSLLNMEDIPTPRYPPAVGAALLALDGV